MQFSTPLSKRAQYPASLAYERGVFFPGTGISATARLALLLKFACNGKSPPSCGRACASCSLQATCKSMFLNNVARKRKQTQLDSQATASCSDHKVIRLVCFAPSSRPLPKIFLGMGLRSRWTIGGEVAGWTDTLPDLEGSVLGSFLTIPPYSSLSFSLS